MKNKPQAQIDLETKITANMEALKKELSNNPNSYKGTAAAMLVYSHYCRNIGYYQGFCSARGYPLDYEFLSEFDRKYSSL